MDYDPKTGLFSKNGRPVGSVRKDGYVILSFGRRNQKLAHRVAWWITYGYWPIEIDHIDGNPTNNAIDNLREVCRQDNLLNSKFHRLGNKAKRRRPYGWRRPRSMPHLRS